MLKRIVLAVFLIFVMFSVAFPTPTRAQGASNAEMAANVGLPATVFIYTELGSVVRYPTKAGGFYDIETSIAAVASGFFVNSEGYIVTAGHVVWSITHSNYREDLVTKGEILAGAAIDYVKQTEPGADQARIQYLTEWFKENGEIRDSIRLVYVILGSFQAGEIAGKSKLAKVIGNPSPFIERDLAILKVDMSNTPSLVVGDSNTLRVGEEVYVIGYPGVVSFSSMLSASTMLSPSLTRGIFSGRKETTFNTPTLQTDASITHGNSGGPALNAKGEVIGVANMGSVSEAGQEVAGFNFLVPSNLVVNYLNENGVENKGGTVDETYRRGLGYYFAGAYASAIADFEAAKRMFPFHWHADELIVDSQNALNRGEKGESSITVSVSPSKTTSGQAVQMKGSIQHAGELLLPVEFDWSGASVTLTYAGPEGASSTKTVSASKDGNFTDAFTTDKAGAWTATASWDGNKDHSGSKSEPASFTVEGGLLGFTIPGVPASILGIPTAYILVGVVAIVVVLVVVLARRRKRPTPTPRPSEAVTYAPAMPTPTGPSASAKTFCVHCGAEIGADTRFCRRCGKGQV
jgi:S1-C subfamily serine protease